MGYRRRTVIAIVAASLILLFAATLLPFVSGHHDPAVTVRHSLTSEEESNNRQVAPRPPNQRHRDWQEPKGASLFDVCGGMPPEQRANHTTRGLFRDEFDTGNDKDDSVEEEESAVVLTVEASHDATDDDAVVISTFRRASSHRNSPLCYYLLRSACIVDGQLVLFENASAAPSPASAMMENTTWVSLGRGTGSAQTSFRLCNELRRKINFRVGLKPWPEVKQRLLAGAGRKLEWRPHAHVLACWQLYGFHLMECLASAYSLQRQHGISNVDVALFNHAATLPRVSSQHFSHATFMGSNASFLDPVSPLAEELRYARNPYWGFYAQNTQLPSNVLEVQRAAFPHGETRCYRQMLLGQQDPRSLRNAQRRIHSWRLRHVLGVANKTREAASKFCSTATARVTIVQRGGLANSIERDETLPNHRHHYDHPRKENLQGRRGFVNVSHVAETVSSVSIPLKCVSAAERVAQCDEASFPPSSGSLMTNVRVIDWAAISLQHQAAIAATTNILVATHGAGNMWLALMPPRSVVVEVWPDCIGRNVYISLAKQHNMRYIPLCQSSSSASSSALKIKGKTSEKSVSAASDASSMATMELITPSVSKVKARSNYMTDDVEVDPALLQAAINTALRFLVRSYECCKG